MSGLQSHPECRIPHIVSAKGVKIITDAGHTLRLTTDHLVYTESCLVPAAEVRPGTILFTSTTIDLKTRVVQVIPEENELYFGLNRLDSVVLANGIRTSTFGRYHMIPALWMGIFGRLAGPHRASIVGDAVVRLLFKLGL